MFRRVVSDVSFTLFCIFFVNVGVSSSADWEKGYAAYRKKNYETALGILRPLAEQGNANVVGKLIYSPRAAQ